MEKETLVKSVRELVKAQPECAVDILRAVTEGMEGFKAAIESQKILEADRAFSGLISLMMSRSETDERKAISMAQAVHLHYPLGIDFQMSKVEVDFLESFCELYFYRTNLHGSEWEQDYADPDYFDMLKAQYVFHYGKPLTLGELAK